MICKVILVVIALSLLAVCSFIRGKDAMETQEEKEEEDREQMQYLSEWIREKGNRTTKK